MLSIFLLPLDSFVKKDNKIIPQNNRQCICCWLNCNRSPGQRFKAKSRDLRPDQLPFVPDQGTCTKTNIYKFGKRVSVWQTSICLANEYLFETRIPNNTWYLSLLDNHLVYNTLYLSPCFLCFFDATRWILLHVW